MDKLEQYRQIVREVIHHYTNITSSQNGVESIAVCDVDSDNYMVVDIGWGNAGRVHSMPIHLRIKNGKIWLEWDGTDQEIALKLLDAGVPKTDIVLAFYRPERRKITEFSVV
jgi:XisI protein